MKRCLFVMLVFVLLISGNSVVHASTKNIDGNIEKNREEIDVLKGEEKSDREKRKSKREEVESLILEIEVLEDENRELDLEIENNNKEIKKIEKEIKKIEKEIEVLEESIEKRKEITNQRLLKAQEKGDTSYLDVLLGADSFKDFISRAYLMSIIIEADNDLVTGLLSDMELVEKKMESVERKKKGLEAKREENKENKKKVKKKIKVINKKKKELDKQILALDMSVKDVKNRQDKLIEEINEQIKEKERVIKEQRIKEEKLIEEQRIKQEKELLKLQTESQMKEQTNISNGSSMVKSARVNSVAPKKSKESSLGGELEWPTDGGYISSGMGTRIHPITKVARLHKGIDIARTDRSTIPPIYAAESGVVVSAGTASGYGNLIKIRHDNGIETLYAHLTTINVSVGQSVKRGETIGIMGTTGMSTGIHLHFEVYENGELRNPLGYF